MNSRNAVFSLSAIALLVVGCSKARNGTVELPATPEAAQPKAATNSPPLAVTITTAKAVYRIGEAPEIQVRIKNLTDKEIYLVGSLDASDCKWRYPHCYFEVVRPNAQAEKGMARCGNTNSLKEEQFVKVPPGGTFDPYLKGEPYHFFGSYQLMARQFEVPGKYTLRFVYSTTSTDIKNWLGDGRWQWEKQPNPRLAELLAKVPKTTVESAPLTIEFVSKDGVPEAATEESDHTAHEARLRQCLKDIIDDIALLKPDYPELAKFDTTPLVAAIGPREGFKWFMGFEYTHNYTHATGKSAGKGPRIGDHGCLIYVAFRPLQEPVQLEETTAFPGFGVKAYWWCALSDGASEGLRGKLDAVVRKHFDRLRASVPLSL